MDEALRCLRDGVVDGRSAPFVLVQDSLDVLGGPALAAKLFSSLCKALRDGRSQANLLSMVPADESCTSYMPELQAVLGTSLQQPCHDPTAPDALQHILASTGDAAPGSKASGPGQGAAKTEPRIALGVDSLTTLMFHHPVYQVLEWVDDVLQQPRLACLLGTIHRDLHESITVKSLERMASCTVRALPCEGQPHVFARTQQPDLAVKVCIKQRTGRVKVLTEYYQQLPDGSLLEVKPLMEPEKPLPMPQADVDPVQDAATVELAKKMTGGMRLTLTQQESAARQTVLLPWEQRQAGAESQDEFVIAPAKGKASISSKAEAIQAAGEGASYGQIFYERDSETDPDSDEDPDDDLDI